MNPVVTSAARADLGRNRESQEDAYGFKLPANLTWAEHNDGLLFVVADGVGGEKAGDLASRTAVQTIIKQYYDGKAPGAAGLRGAIQAANQRILEQAQSALYAGMATTVVCALIRNGELIIAHAGDSRAYLYRRGELIQLTRDHSWVEDQVQRGRMTPEEAAHSPHRHMITRSLGRRADFEPEVARRGYVQGGDRILLCTDGLHDAVSEDQLLRAMNHGHAGETCDNLVELALECNSADNITALVIDIRLVEDDTTHVEGESVVATRPAAGLRDETEPGSQEPALTAAPTAQSATERDERRSVPGRDTAAHIQQTLLAEWTWQVCGPGIMPQPQQQDVEIPGSRPSRLIVRTDLEKPNPRLVRAVRLVVELRAADGDAAEATAALQVKPFGYYSAPGGRIDGAMAGRTGSRGDLTVGHASLACSVEEVTCNTPDEQVFKELILRFRVEAVSPKTAA